MRRDLRNAVICGVCAFAAGLTLRAEAGPQFFADPVDIATLIQTVVPGMAIDMDKDGDLDLLYSTSANSQIEWLEYVGGEDHPYATHTITHFNSVVPGPFSVVAGDIDGDGDNDVVAAGQLTGYTSELAWFENDGDPRDGLWRKRTIFLGTPPFLFPPVDADGDGDLDLFGQASQNTIHLFRNNRESPLSNWQRDVFSPFDQPVLTDVDLNGKPDILSHLSNVLRRTEFGMNPQTVDTTYPVIALTLTKFLVDDFNGDGYPDLIKRMNDGKVYIHENSKDASLFGAARLLYARPGGGSGSQPVLQRTLDVDGDGWRDFYLFDGNSDAVLFLNQQTNPASFRAYTGATTWFPTGTYYDYDADGSPDVISGSSNKMRFHKNIIGAAIESMVIREAINDGLLMPGESGFVDVTVKNLAVVPREGGTIGLTSGAGIVLDATSFPIGSLGGKESAVFSFPFTVTVGATCGSSVVFIAGLPFHSEQISTRLGAPINSLLVFDESPALAIPDGNSGGLTRTFTSTGFVQKIQSIKVSVNIQHTYRGDLLVKFRVPSGSETTLFTGNPNDSTDNLIQEYTITAFNGQQALGDYSLQVIDRLAGETGVLNSWHLEVNYSSTSCPPQELLNALYRIMGIPHDTTGSDRNSDGIVDAADVVVP